MKNKPAITDKSTSLLENVKNQSTKERIKTFLKHKPCVQYPPEEIGEKYLENKLEDKHKPICQLTQYVNNTNNQNKSGFKIKANEPVKKYILELMLRCNLKENIINQLHKLIDGVSSEKALQDRFNKYGGKLFKSKNPKTNEYQICYTPTKDSYIRETIDALVTLKNNDHFRLNQKQDETFEKNIEYLSTEALNITDPTERLKVLTALYRIMPADYKTKGQTLFEKIMEGQSLNLDKNPKHLSHIQAYLASTEELDFDIHYTTILRNLSNTGWFEPDSEYGKEVRKRIGNIAHILLDKDSDRLPEIVKHIIRASVIAGNTMPDCCQGYKKYYENQKKEWIKLTKTMYKNHYENCLKDIQDSTKAINDSTKAINKTRGLSHSSHKIEKIENKVLGNLDRLILLSEKVVNAVKRIGQIPIFNGVDLSDMMNQQENILDYLRNNLNETYNGYLSKPPSKKTETKTHISNNNDHIPNNNDHIPNNNLLCEEKDKDKKTESKKKEMEKYDETSQKIKEQMAKFEERLEEKLKTLKRIIKTEKTEKNKHKNETSYYQVEEQKEKQGFDMSFYEGTFPTNVKDLIYDKNSMDNIDDTINSIVAKLTKSKPDNHWQANDFKKRNSSVQVEFEGQTVTLKHATWSEDKETQTIFYIENNNEKCLIFAVGEHASSNIYKNIKSNQFDIKNDQKKNLNAINLNENKILVVTIKKK
tara:strand:- start:906 stop:3017 length:2112 start_codon:yes stop_codon:yes gene_type:complete